MKGNRTFMLWSLWLTLSVSAGLFVLAVIYYGGNRSFLLIGKTTNGHHQIELACDTCHTSVFGGPEVLQNACVKCHGDELKLANDAHPQSKFTDPRNADRTAKLDARYCVTCHQEHRPGVTRAMGVTLASDFCVLCHKDIGDERPSHKDLKFTTCASAGCHNFHDNRALYEDFLRQHRNEPAHLEKQKIALATFLAETRANAIKIPKVLTQADADAPLAHAKDAAVLAAWSGDAHAKAGVNCSGCHVAKADAAAWIEKPGLDTCKGCHADAARTFTEGKHGMRLADGLLVSRDGPFGLFKQTKLPAMTPAQARLPMKTDANHKTLGCNSCHSAHSYDRVAAQVTACAGCHDDAHTKAYFDSPHHNLFKKEIAGELPKGSGVSCATCHMPIVQTRNSDGDRTTFVTHNQNENLRPNEKMVRSVCGNCHGQQFILDALADTALVAKNFTAPPSVHVESLEWVERRAKQKRRRKRDD